MFISRKEHPAMRPAPTFVVVRESNLSSCSCCCWEGHVFEVVRVEFMDHNASNSSIHGLLEVRGMNWEIS